MIESRTTKLFKNGGSQAVRLPADFRFKTEEIYLTRDAITGDVTLSSHPSSKAWQNFFDLLNRIQVPDDFMCTRPLNIVPENKGIFDDEIQ